MQDRLVLGARDVPCPVCKAPVNEPCVYVKHQDPAYRGSQMRFVHHEERWYTAQHDAQRAVDALLDQ